jgi:hypothetical protein
MSEFAGLAAEGFCAKAGAAANMMSAGTSRIFFMPVSSGCSSTTLNRKWSSFATVGMHPLLLACPAGLDRQPLMNGSALNDAEMLNSL